MIELQTTNELAPFTRSRPESAAVAGCLTANLEMQKPMNTTDQQQDGAQPNDSRQVPSECEREAALGACRPLTEQETKSLGEVVAALNNACDEVSRSVASLTDIGWHKIADRLVAHHGSLAGISYGIEMMGVRATPAA